MCMCKYRISIGFFYSKKRKWLAAIWKYWLEKAQSLSKGLMRGQTETVKMNWIMVSIPQTKCGVLL